MLTEICQYLHNWFEREKYFGKFEIKDGVVTSYNDGTILAEGQYFRIINSLFNDGVHKYGDELKDETFEGAVWSLGIPEAFLGLVGEVETWQAKHGAADSVEMGPYSSESFSGYSYSKSSDASGGWQSAYGSRLNAWRKI